MSDLQDQFRNLDVARWPQEVRFEFEREICDDPTASALDYLDDDNPDDSERLAARRRGEWWFVGIRAKATVFVPVGGSSFTRYEMASAGLWGIESDSGDQYFAEVFDEEKASLIADLKQIGEAAAKLNP